MDISYLLWLQDFRLDTHDFWTPLLKGISTFSASYLLFLPVFIYWCWDKRRGLLTLASLYVCLTLTALVKLTACVYRPWIKDPRIMPVGNLPTSYSFPSRHSSLAASIYVGSATAFWQKKWLKWLAVVCVILALLTGFSRNYLGVHTPQDVLVGFVLSLICLVGVWKLGDYIQQNPAQENKILLLTALACMAALGYICCKPYPMDYVDGKLLVNPAKMLKGGFEGIGALWAFCIARYIEKTWIRFQTPGLNVKGILCSLAGGVPLYFLLIYTAKPLKHLLGANWSRFAWSALLVFYVIALYPLVLKWIFSKKS